MARELDRRVDRFRRRSFVSSWHLWESSRRRHVQVGIREGLGTTEAGLMEHKMGSCEDAFWSAATGGGAARFSSAPVPISTHLYSTFRQMLADASFYSPLSKSRIMTHLFMLPFIIILCEIFFLFVFICAVARRQLHIRAKYTFIVSLSARCFPYRFRFPFS